MDFMKIIIKKIFLFPSLDFWQIAIRESFQVTNEILPFSSVVKLRSTAICAAIYPEI